MKLTVNTIALGALITVALSAPLTAFALPNDQEQPLYLKADYADLNQKSGHSIFRGNVIVDQGSSHLRATKALIDTDKQNKLKQAIAIGNKKRLAHFWTLHEKSDPEIHGYADRITYQPKRHKLILQGHASIKQGNDYYKAPKITYDMDAKHVISTANAKIRTSIVIHPANHKRKKA